MDTNQKQTLYEQIIDNLALSIKQVHIRYEDSISCPGTPFAAGITLTNLSVKSTDAGWNITFVQEQQVNTHKLLQMDELAVYWCPAAKLLSEEGLSTEDLRSCIFSGTVEAEAELHHVLEPVNLTARLRRIKSAGISSLPKTTLDVILDALPVRLTRSQFQTANSLLVRVAEFQLEQKRQGRRFARVQWWRPLAAFNTFSVGSDDRKRGVRATWRYAIKAAILGAVDGLDGDGAAGSAAAFTFNTAGTASPCPFWIDSTMMAERRQLRCTYLSLRKKLVASAGLDRGIQAELVQHEAVLSLSDVLEFRAEARRAIDRDPELARLASEAQAAAHAAAQAKKEAEGVGWGTWLFRRSGASAKGSAAEGGLPADAAINTGSSSSSIGGTGGAFSAAELYVGARILFTLGSATVELIDEQPSAVPGLSPKQSPIARLEFDTLCCSLEHRPVAGSYRAAVALREMEVLDLLTEDSAFGVLVGPKAGVGATQTTAAAAAAAAAVRVRPRRVSRSESAGGIASEHRSFFDEGPRLAKLPPAWREEGVAVDSTLFRGLVESKPATVHADYRVRVFTQPLEIVLNPRVIKAVLSFGSASAGTSTVGSSSSAALTADVDAADVDGAEDERDNKGGRKTLPSIDVLVDIRAPLIIIPEDFSSRSASVVLIDLGHLMTSRTCSDVVQRKSSILEDGSSIGKGVGASASAGYEESTALPELQGAADTSRYDNDGDDDEDDDDDDFQTPPSTPDGSEDEGGDDGDVGNGTDSSFAAVATATTVEDATASNISGDGENSGNAARGSSFAPAPPFVFELRLTDVQVIAARLSDDWRGALGSQTSRMHVLERLSLGCTLEQSPYVYQVEADEAPTQISGTLPLLQLSFTERKVMHLATCMKALGNGGISSESGDGRAESSAAARTGSSNSFSSAPSSPLRSSSMSPSTPLPFEPVAAPTFPTRSASGTAPIVSQQKLRVDFGIERVDIELQTVASGEEDPKPLARLTVGGVRADLLQGTVEDCLSFVVTSLLINDYQRDTGSAFSKLAWTTESSESDAATAEETAFVHLTYIVRHQNDDRSANGGQQATPPQTVSIDFNTLNLNINRRTVASLMDYFKAAPSGESTAGSWAEGGARGAAIAKPPSDASAAMHDAKVRAVSDEGAGEGKSTGEGGGHAVGLQAGDNSAALRLSIQIVRLGVTLVEDQHGIIQAGVEGFTMEANMLEGATRAAGTLGKVAVTDLMPEGGLYRDVFRTTGGEVLKFDYTYKHERDPRADAHPIIIKMSMASVHMIYTNRFVDRLNTYINRFQEIQRIVREKAEGFIAELEESRLHLQVNIEIDNPVVLIPKNSFSEDVFRADFRRLMISNALHEAPKMPADFDTSHCPTNPQRRSLVDSFKIELCEMNLYSGKRPLPAASASAAPQSFGGRRGSGIVDVNANTGDTGIGRSSMGEQPAAPAAASDSLESILEKCSLELQWDRKLDAWRTDYSNNTMSGAVSNVDVHVSKSQYLLFMGILGENFGAENNVVGLGISERQEGTEQPPDTNETADMRYPGTARVRAGTAAPQHPAFDFSLELQNACFRIFEDRAYAEDGSVIQEEAPLARLDLIDSTLSFSSFDNGEPGGNSSTTTMYSKAIRVHDTRRCKEGEENLYTQILRPMDDDLRGGAEGGSAGDYARGENDAESPPLLQVTFRSTEQTNKVNVLLNKTRLVLPLFSWVMQVKEWMFNMPAGMLQLQEKIDAGQLESPKERGTEVNLPKHMNVSISVTNPEFVVVEDRFREDTNAVVMKFCAVIRYNHTPQELADLFDQGGLRSAGDTSDVETVFDSLEIFSCQLNREAATALSIVDPCTVEMNVNRQIPKEPPKVALTRFVFDISGSTTDVRAVSDEKAVCGRFSYRDFRLFLSITSTMVDEMQDAAVEPVLPAEPSPVESIRRLLAMGFPPVHCVLALIYAAGSVERAAIRLCRTVSSVEHGLLDEGDHLEVLRTAAYLAREALSDTLLNMEEEDQHMRQLTEAMAPASPFPATTNVSRIMSVERQVAGENSRACHSPSGSDVHNQTEYINATSTMASLSMQTPDQSFESHGRSPAGGAERQTSVLLYDQTDDPRLRPLVDGGIPPGHCEEALENAGGNMLDAVLWLMEHRPPHSIVDRDDSSVVEERARSTSPSLVAKATAKSAPSSSASAKTVNETNSSISDVVAEKVELELQVPAIRVCLIDDYDGKDLPLVELKLDSVSTFVHIDTKDGSSPKIAGTCQGKASADFYNSNLSAWEPVVESWPVLVSVPHASFGTTPGITFEVNAESRLELNVTPTLVTSVASTVASWSSGFAEGKPLSDREKFEPYRIRNSSGRAASFQSVLTNGTKSEPTALPEGATSAVIFDEGRVSSKMRHNATHHTKVHKVAIKLQGWYEVQPAVTVDRVGTFVFLMKPEPENQNRLSSRIVVTVSVQDGCKLIDVHSAFVIENKMTVPVDIKIESTTDRTTSVTLPLLKAGRSIAVPVHLTSGIIKMKPHEWGCEWNRKGLWWEHFPKGNRRVGLGLACAKIREEPDAGPGGGDIKPPFRFCVSVVEEPYPATQKPCPGHTLTLLPPLVVENLLPVPLEFHVVGSAAGGELAAGESDSLYIVDLHEDLRLTVRIAGFEWSDPALISDAKGQQKSDETLRLVDSLGRVLYLVVSNHLKPGSGGSRTVAVLAQYWIVNQTGLPLEYKQSGRTRKSAAGQREAAADRRSADPFMFSCDVDNASSHNRCQLRVGSRSDWGPDVAIDVVGRAGTLRVRESEAHGPLAKMFEFGVMVNRGQGRFYPTKIISFLPRHVIVNSTSRVIQVAQAKVLRKVEQFDAGTDHPYHWPRPKEAHRMCIRFADRACQWSTSFPIHEVGTIHVKLQNPQSAHQFSLVRIEVRLKGATVQAILTEADEVPPFRIENRSFVPLTYHQQGVSLVSTIGPKSSTAYTWDDLTKELMMVVCVEGVAYKSARAYDLARVHVGSDLAYPQQFYIIGPNALVLTGKPYTGAAANSDTLVPKLEPRQARDPMQLWRTNTQGQLVNSAGYVLEVSSQNTRGVRLQRLSTSIAHLDNQKWMFDTKRFINFSRKGGGGGGAVKLSVTDDNGLQLVPLDVEAPPITKHSIPPGCGELSVRVTADGPTRILLIEDKAESSEAEWTALGRLGMEQQMSAVSARRANGGSRGDDGGAGDDNGGGAGEGGGWKLNLKLDMQAGIGISLVDHDELVYLSSNDIQLTVSGDETTQSLELSVQHIQLDDQTVRANSEAAVFYPQLPGGNRASVRPPPIFQLTVVRSFEGGDKAVILKQLEVDIQPFCLHMRDELLLRVLALAPYIHWGAAAAAAAAARDPEASTAAAAEAADYVATMAQSHHGTGEVTEQTGAWRSIYFESLRLNSMKLTVGYEKSSMRLSADLETLKRELGIGLYPQFEGAVIELETFALDRPFADLGTIVDLIIEHHKQEILRQAYMVLGSVDFLGNPIGVLNHVGLGITEFVSEVGDGHLAGGVASLAQHVAFGLADGASKITGSISSGLGKAAMDRDFQKSREKRKLADKDVTGHLQNGVSSLGRGILYGIAGMFTAPLKGLQAEGVKGLASGTVKGVVGAVAKPLAGVFDLASSTTAAVRTAAGQTSAIPSRARAARAIGPDDVLRPYRVEDANGRKLLHQLNGGDRKERYVSQITVSANHSTTLLVTSDRVIVLGTVASGGIGVTAEIWYNGLYKYTVYRERNSKHDPTAISSHQFTIYLRFTVSKEMTEKVQERLELNATTACTLDAPTWGLTSQRTTLQVPCLNQRTAQEALEQIQFAFAFFSERTVKILNTGL